MENIGIDQLEHFWRVPSKTQLVETLGGLLDCVVRPAARQEKRMSVSELFSSAGSLSTRTDREGLIILTTHDQRVIFSVKPFWLLLKLWSKVTRMQAKRCEMPLKLYF